MSVPPPFDQLNIQRSATLSECGRYRYALTRHWGDPHAEAVGWIMLNPSTADANADDPTIRRCMGFAHAWGFGGIRVANLYNLRATDPSELETDEFPLAPAGAPVALRHDILRAIFENRRCRMIIAAWGSHAVVEKHQTPVAVRAACVTQRAVVHCLDLCQDGSPRHPLYVKGNTKPRIWFDGRAKEATS